MRKQVTWLLPAAAALFYPQAVRALYESGRLLGEGRWAWVAVAISCAVVYGVPAAGIVVAYLLGRRDRISSAELTARRLSHLAVATPSLFVLIGVMFFLLHSNGVAVFWWGLWLTVLAVGVWAARRAGAESLVSPRPNPIWLRKAHGTSALLVVLLFLGWHLLNHASAAVSLDLNHATMLTLRKWYRSELVEPVVVALMLFQVGSGAMLFWKATSERSDVYRTLQTSTGALLTVFILSHLTAVFILGRGVLKADTTFLWASGAPTGLLPDAWNVRLIPHYSLGVWSVILHLGLGLRDVLLAHGVSPAAAGRVAWAIGTAGAAVAVTITVAQLQVHGPS